MENLLIADFVRASFLLTIFDGHPELLNLVDAYHNSRSVESVILTNLRNLYSREKIKYNQNQRHVLIKEPHYCHDCTNPITPCSGHD